MDSTLVALKGVMARLKAYSALTTLVTDSDGTRIYTNVPQQVAFPYVVVEINSRPWAQDDDSNMSHIIRVHGFSRDSSPVEAMQITQETFNALDRQESNITLDSGSVVLCRYSGLKETFKETDGITWHSVTEFELIID